MGLSDQPPPPGASKQRGRPRKFEISATIDKAVELFWKKGIANSTTRELESFLGLSQSSLYNQFGSKQRLLETALDRYEELASQALLLPLKTNPNGILAIKDFFDNLASWVTKGEHRGCMLINMMAEDGNNSPTIKARTFKYRSRVKIGLRDALNRTLPDDCKDSMDVEQKADLLLTFVLGFNIAVRGGANKKELDKMLGAISTLVDIWKSEMLS